MLKQLSTPWKIFYTTTLLLAIGYVGVLVYVHKTFADAAVEHWTHYNAMVVDITRSGQDFTVNTKHVAGYHNHHTHNVTGFTIRAKWEWKDVTDSILEAGPLPPDDDVSFALDAGGGGAGSEFTVFRSKTKTLNFTHDYQAGAYTNLFNPEWDNTPPGGFVQAEKFTATFDPDLFDPGVTPPTPVEEVKTSGDH